MRLRSPREGKHKGDKPRVLLISNNLILKEHHSMDATELANRWQRDGYDVATRHDPEGKSRRAGL